MKKLLNSLFIFFLIFLSSCKAFPATSINSPENESANQEVGKAIKSQLAYQSLVINTPCDFPCWNGIEPGHPDSGLFMLDNIGQIDRLWGFKSNSTIVDGKERTYLSFSIVSNSFPVAGYATNPYTGETYVEIIIDEGIVEEISIVPDNQQIHEFLDENGSPENVAKVGIWYEDESVMMPYFALHYPGLDTLIFLGDIESESFSLGENTQIVMIVTGSQHYLDSVIQDGGEIVTQSWKGMGNYDW